MKQTDFKKINLFFLTLFFWPFFLEFIPSHNPFLFSLTMGIDKSALSSGCSVLFFNKHFSFCWQLLLLKLSSIYNQVISGIICYFSDEYLLIVGICRYLLLYTIEPHHLHNFHLDNVMLVGYISFSFFYFF